jgi:hypothetical protein
MPPASAPSTDTRQAGQPQIQRSEQICADAGAEHQRRQIRPFERRRWKWLGVELRALNALQPPACRGRRQPCCNIEDGVKACPAHAADDNAVWFGSPTTLAEATNNFHGLMVRSAAKQRVSNHVCCIHPSRRIACAMLLRMRSGQYAGMFGNAVLVRRVVLVGIDPAQHFLEMILD